MKKLSSRLVLSLAFFLSSLAIYNQVEGAFAPPPAPVTAVEVARPMPPVAHQTEFQVAGTWEQYSIEADGHREFMARLEIRKDGDQYIADPVSVSEFTFPKHAYRSFDHQFRDGIWTFREDWDGGETGEFVLVRNDAGEFEGTAYHLGCASGFQTVFVPVSD